MAVTIEMIKQLREATGAGVLDCRNALEGANQDYDQALGILWKKGLAAAAKRTERPATQGVIELYSHGNGRIGVMVEVNTETDFAARSPAFRTLVHELALQIAAASPRYVQEGDIPAEEILEVSQKAVSKARAEGKPEAVIPQIVEGMLAKYKVEKVLLRQVSIRDEKTTIEQHLNQAIAAVGENIVIRRFARWELGETSAME